FYNRRGSLIVTVDPVLRPNGTVYNPRFENNGIGRAYGLELLIRREITSRLYGWLAYTLSRSQILPNRGDAWRAFQFDQPHILTIVAGYRPKPQWDLSTRFRFVSGNPYAPVDFATFDADSGNFVPTRGEVGDSREPPFLQLDARAQYTWTWDAWQLSLYLDVQNVTNHTIEEFHVYDYRFRDQGTRRLSTILLIPPECVALAQADDDLKGLGGIRVQYSFSVDHGDGSGTAYGSKVLLYSPRGGTPNQNPAIASVQLSREGLNL